MCRLIMRGGLRLGIVNRILLNIPHSLIREIADASTILLKNENGTLPLSAPGSIAIIGNGAGNNSQGINGCVDRSCDDGVLAVGWGSGTAEFPYLITVRILAQWSM